MKTVDIIQIHEILNGLSLAGLSFKGQRAILKTLRQLKPTAERYVEDMKEATGKLKPEGFEEIETKAIAHNEALESGSEHGRLQGEELKAVARVYADFNKKLSDYANDLGNEEVEISLEKIPEEDFEKLLSANAEKIEAGKLALIEDVLCN
ncbi:MAG: hypothetical protein LUH10_00550 [Tannerellaceae bacterium]|nr:hypothetical protein [Tannerellaceae bacterium]